MALLFPNVKYRAGDHTIAKAISAPQFSAPLDGVNTNYLLSQEFMQAQLSFATLALNTAHPDYTDYVLVSETEKQPVGGGMVRWMRNYAKVPDSYSEPGGNIAYHFIGLEGIVGAIGVTSVTGRERFSRNVLVKITRDFFLVGTGGTHATFQAIPKIAATRYYYGATPFLDIDYLANAPPFLQASTPSRTQYEAMITADAAGEDSFSIVTEDSVVMRWQGNIYVRETRRIKAL